MLQKYESIMKELLDEPLISVQEHDNTITLLSNDWEVVFKKTEVLKELKYMKMTVRYIGE
jgi:nitrogen fixation protein